MKFKIFISTALVLAVISLKATILEVPADYPSIQSAINAAVSGDTIVASPGTYFENINFRGKNVFVTSLYYLDADTSYITSTIIDGSSPVNPDTASCVIFCSGEDSTAVLQGFTITGGVGTKWTDIHGAGVYREGGGVLIELSSPTVRHNVIIHNACTDLSGVVSTGGGGIRIGDGEPMIANNDIMYNQARYGPGIVMNYTGGTITNNIIAANSGGEEFYGGAGIWILRNLSTKPKVITNNTIVENYAAVTGGTGGISVWSAGNVFIKNNIIYGNIPGPQIKASMSTPVVTYCDVQGGYTGEGNIDQNPVFGPVSFYLGDGSPCIDSGDPGETYYDLENPQSPGFALFPSMGTLRNDMGAYGGPGAALLPPFETLYTGIGEYAANRGFIVFPNPTHGIFTIQGPGELVIFNLLGEEVYSSGLNSDNNLINLGDLPDGIYVFRLKQGNNTMSGKVLVKR